MRPGSIREFFRPPPASPVEEGIREKVSHRIRSIAEALQETAALLCSLQNRNLSTAMKANHLDLVTEADLAAEKTLTGEIRRLFPEDAILAEESGIDGDCDAAPFTWVIDPLDGTLNYAHGLPLYAISIGIVRRGRPVGGVIRLPALNNTYRAIAGEGAFRDEKPIQVSTQSKPGRALTVTGFPHNRAEILEDLVAGVRNVLGHLGGLRRTGSAALDLCWLAEGRFDALYELNLNPWDTCAGSLIAREAGARITNLRGATYHPGMISIVGSNGLFHDQLLQILAPLDPLEND